MRMWPWDRGSHGLLWQRECGSGGESPEPPPACAGARIKPPPAGASLWPVPLVEEVAVTGRAALGAGVGWWLRSHPRIPGFILVAAMVLPQAPKRVTRVWVMLSPTVQECPGIPCVAMLSAWVAAGQEGVAEQPSSLGRGGRHLKLCAVRGQNAAWMMTLQDFFQGWPAAVAQPWP